MQGRLSPPPPQRIQAFPWGRWGLEFEAARELGLDGIEWLFEADDWRNNPILAASGIGQIRRRVAETGVAVFSVCADYFMLHPFFRVSANERLRSIDVLGRLIECAAEVGAKTVLIPVLEVSEIRTQEDQDQLLDSLARPLEIADRCHMRLGLESELSASRYLNLVEQKPHPSLGVYFDVGNATAAGHDAAKDLIVLGHHLVGVHMKDRRRGGSTIPLGEGDTDYPAVFASLKEVGYSGPLVLQAASGPDYLGHARRSREFVLRHRGGRA